ncbi:hypothetical protein TAMYLO_430003 [Tenacibaculum amylolyticum]
MKNRLGWYNLRPQLEPDALRDKNAFYHNLDYWDRINMMQFLIHYEQYKRYSSPPYVLSTEAARIFNQFNNRIDIANTNFIENKVRDQYKDYTVYHPLYWKIILKNKYHNNPFAAGSAKRDHNRLRDQAIANQIRRTPIGTTLNVDNIVRKLGITDADQQEWLNANPNKAAEYVNRLRAAAQQDSEDTSNPLPTDEEGNEEPEGQAEQLERIRILRELAAGAKVVKLVKEVNITDNNQKNWIYRNHQYANQLVRFADENRFNNFLPEAKKEQINKTIGLLPIFESLSQYWPQNDEQWAVVGELFKSVAVEIGLSFIPGYDIVDTIKSFNNGDVLGVVLGLAGIISTAAGSTVFKGAVKAGSKLYKILRIFRQIQHFASKLGKIIARGFKPKLADDIIELTNNAGHVIARGADEVEDFASVLSKLDNLPNAKKLIENGADHNLVKRIDNLSSDQLNKLDHLIRNQRKPAGYSGQFDFTATKTIDGQQVSVRYDKNGFPDFKNYSLDQGFTYKADNLIGNGTTTDFTNATNWLRNKFPDKNIRSRGTAVEIDGIIYTWHHHQDGKSLMPVLKNIHRSFSHSGGSAIIDRGLQGVFSSPF